MGGAWRLLVHAARGPVAVCEHQGVCRHASQSSASCVCGVPLRCCASAMQLAPPAVAACRPGGGCAHADKQVRAVQQQYATRRGPNSDDFIPVKGGSDFGGHSRGGSMGGKDESVFDPEEALLAKVHPDNTPPSAEKSIRHNNLNGVCAAGRVTPRCRGSKRKQASRACCFVLHGRSRSNDDVCPVRCSPSTCCAG